MVWSASRILQNYRRKKQLHGLHYREWMHDLAGYEASLAFLRAVYRGGTRRGPPIHPAARSRGDFVGSVSNPIRLASSCGPLGFDWPSQAIPRPLQLSRLGRDHRRHRGGGGLRLSAGDAEDRLGWRRRWRRYATARIGGA